MSTGFVESKMGGPMQEVAPIAANGATSATLSAAPSPALDGVAADALLEPWFPCLQERTGVLRLFDRLSAEQIAMVAGGQLERLLAGAEPADLGPAPAGPAPAPGPLLERVHTLLLAAAARFTAGYPADEYLELAGLACELPAGHPDASVAASVRELLHRHARHLATDPPRRGPLVPGIHLIFVAAAVARTPNLPIPSVAE